jgi:transcriptional regulator of arginine metabolism
MARSQSEKERRHKLIREIIARNEVHNHEQLLALLEVESVVATQPTLSRDLRELGAQKTARGYRLEPADADGADRRRRLQTSLKGALVGASRSGTLVVLRTRAGVGRELAAGLKAALGTRVAGVLGDDDTVFIAAPSGAEARGTLRWIQDAARL